MKNLLTKIRSNYLLISLGLTLIAFPMIFAIHGFRIIYESNDDFFISHFIVNGYDKCLFVSYFITAVLVPLQKIFTTINVWIVSQLLFSFFSVVIIIYIFLSKFGMKLGILFSVLFHVIFGYCNFISLEFTRTPVTMASAGYLLIISFLFLDKEDKNHKWINWQSVIGVILIILSSFYRFYSFLSVSGVFFVFIFASAFTKWLRLRKENMKMDYFVFVKKILFILLMLIVAFALEKLSGYIKTNDKDYLYHEKYQAARSACIDIRPSPYQGNEEFYNSIGIVSDNDITLLCQWTVSDEDFFTLEKLKAIAEYSKKDSGFIPRFTKSITYIFNIISRRLGSASTTIIIVGICFIIFLILLIVFRNKWKRIVPFLFAVTWVGFLYLFYAFYQYIFMYMAVFPGILMVFLSFLCNRYSFIIHCFMSAVLFTLIIYLEFTYTNFRATYTLIFPAMCIIIYNFDKNDIRSYVQKMHPNMQKGIFTASIMIYLAITIMVFKICPFIYSPENDNSAFIYIENHKENFYFLDQAQRHAMKNLDAAIWKAELSSNSIHTSWATGSEFFHNRQKEYHLEHLYADMIDNPHAFYVSDRKISMVEKYYNDHYSNGKNNIVLERVANDVMEVYRIRRKD